MKLLEQSPGLKSAVSRGKAKWRLSNSLNNGGVRYHQKIETTQPISRNTSNKLMPLTEGQRNAMQGGRDRNIERAQEIKDRRKQWLGNKTAPMIGPAGKLSGSASDSIR